MLLLLSPAKTLNFDIEPRVQEHTLPRFMNESTRLMDKLKKLSSRQIAKLMNINVQLADLNYERNLSWKPPFSPLNSKPALFVFGGDVYRGMDAVNFSDKEISFAQRKLRILSGLYGILRPLDLIQPYRLEMGAKFKVTQKKNDLYKFWGSQISEAINKDLKKEGDEIVLNLASNEYFKAVDKKELDAILITPEFRDWKNGEFKSIMTYTKVARGLMAKYVISNEINDEEGLKGFDFEGYSYNDRLSSPLNPVFTRE